MKLLTQDSDNPDLRDRGYIYWRLLSTDPAAAKEVVLAEKPLISEETDLLEPTLLDELICHIASLASVYHKPPSAFVEGRAGLRKILPASTRYKSFLLLVINLPNQLRSPGNYISLYLWNRLEGSGDAPPAVIPSQDTLIGDLLSMDINPPQVMAAAAPAAPFGGVDLLGGGLDALVCLKL